jgi:hypothetical protein
MTSAVLNLHTTSTTAQATQESAPALTAAALGFDRLASRITGITPQLLASTSAEHPALNVGMELARMECWLLCNDRPAHLGEFVAERLAKAASFKTRAGAHKGRRMLAPLRAGQQPTVTAVL